MLVEAILPRARTRLATIDLGASMAAAAQLLMQPETELLVVCDADSRSAGVVTKTDIVAEAARAGCALPDITPVSSLMTPTVLSCAASDALKDVLTELRQRRLRRLPILDDARRPVGVLYARDALQALLCEAEFQEGALRDYIQGVGYH